MFKKLSRRFVVMTFIVMFTSSFLSFVIANVYYHVNLKPKNDERVTEILIQQKKFAETHDVPAEDLFLEMANLNFQVLAIHNGEKSFYGTPFRVDNVSHDALTKDIYHGIKQRPFDLFITGFFDNETENTVGMNMNIKGESYYVFIRPDVGQSMGEFRVFLAVLMLLTMITSAVFVFLSSSMIVSPVVKLKEAARKIASGQYGVDAEINRKDEIGTLAREMKSMGEAIEEHQAMNQRFVANVSHEIQSPIANLLGQIERLQETKDLSLIPNISYQSKRLSSLTKQLLLLASIEQSEQQLEKEQFLGKGLVQEVIQSFMYQLDQKDIFVMTKMKDERIYGNRDLLYQALSNLLSNAIKYSPREGEITIQLTSNDKYSIIKVIDKGQGMDLETKKHLFERFYKSHAKEDDIPSNGLGMSIVKDIIELHHGKIIVQSELSKGSSIELWIAKQ